MTPTARWRAIWSKVADGGFVLPALALSVAVFFYPTVNALWHGFTDWEPGLGSSYTGLTNLRKLVSDDTFHQVLRNSGIYLLAVPILVIVPLLVAFMLYDRVPAAGLFRTIYLFPLVLSPPLLGLLFQSVLDPTSGLLDETLRRVGLGALARSWLDDPAWVKPSIIAVVLWGGMGVSILIFHAGLSAIPPDLFEAAELDGASWWGKVRYVMVPGIRPVIEAVTALVVVGVFTSMFGLIQVLTNGGPNQRSASIDFDIYSRALTLQDYGGASAEAGVLLVLVVAMVGVLMLARTVINRPRPLPGPFAREPFGDRVRASSAARALRRVRVPRTRLSRRRRSSRSWSIPRLIVAIALAIFFLYPLIYLIGTAVKTQANFDDDPVGLPRSFTLSFLKESWTTVGLGHAMVNSVIAVGIGVVLCTVVSSLASFWFIRHKGRLRIVLFSAMSVFYFVPIIVWIIPLDIQTARLGFANNILALGVIYGASQLPFGIALLTVYLSRGISDEMLEAARVDGASLPRQYRHLVLPLSKPALAALIPLVTAFLWGDLVIGLILLNDTAKYPVTLAATQLVGRENASVQASAAACVISFFPLLVLFAVSQRWMQRGITAGVGRV